MGSYKIAIVQQGNESAWRDYWINSQAEGHADEAPVELGRTKIVEASTLAAAIEIVTREHPACTVMLAGGSSSMA